METGRRLYPSVPVFLVFLMFITIHGTPSNVNLEISDLEVTYVHLRLASFKG